MIKWNRKPRRLLSMLLAWMMIFTLVQGNVYAAPESSAAGSGLTECHKEHDADCGYEEELVGSGCAHVHDVDCGYSEGTAGSPCKWIPDGDGGADEASPSNTQPHEHVHDEDCGYVEAVPESPCTHEHNESCGYVEQMVVTSPCTHECELCAPEKGLMLLQENDDWAYDPDTKTLTAYTDAGTKSWLDDKTIPHSEIRSIVVEEGVVTIQESAYVMCDGPDLTEITIAASVKTISQYAFQRTLADEVNFHMKGKTPPVLENNAIPTGGKDRYTIYVPIGAKAAYEAAENWRLYKIVEETPEEDKPVTLYFGQGKDGWSLYKDANLTKQYTTGMTYTWSADANTLTLSGLDFSTKSPVALNMSGGNKLILEDGTENRLVSTYSGVEETYGIWTDGSLEIDGSGSLYTQSGNCTSAETDKVSASGLAVLGGLTTLGGSITCYGGDTGITTENLTFTGGSIVGRGDTTGIEIKGSFDTVDGDCITTGRSNPDSGALSDAEFRQGSGGFYVGEDVAKYVRLRKTQQVTFVSLTANGTAGGVTTSELTITLDQDVEGLEAQDIQVEGFSVRSFDKGVGTGVYKLKILQLEVEDGQNVKVELSKTGVIFTPASMTTAVHKGGAYDHGLYFGIGSSSSQWGLFKDDNFTEEFTDGQNETWAVEENKLILKGLNFRTTAPTVLTMILPDGGSGYIELHGDNYLISDYEGPETTYGILADLGDNKGGSVGQTDTVNLDLYILGDGSLEASGGTINRPDPGDYADKRSVGLWCYGTCHFEGGNLSFFGGSATGIATYSRGVDCKRAEVGTSLIAAGNTEGWRGTEVWANSWMRVDENKGYKLRGRVDRDNGLLQDAFYGRAEMDTYRSGKVMIDSEVNIAKYVAVVDLSEKVSFKELSADGVSETTTTSELILTFDQDVPEFTADNITVTGATKGELTKVDGETGVYKLGISDITVANGEKVKVEVAKDWYSFTPSEMEVVVYKEVLPISTITFNAAGGTVTQESAETGTDGKLASLPEPVREGYTFGGWFTAESGGEKIKSDHIFREDMTIYAQWTENTYTITFDAAGGTVTLGSAKTGEGRKLESLPTPTREGYTFEGWFTAQTEGEAVTADHIYTADTTIYARWTENIYTITFDAAGGTVTQESAKTGEGRKLASLPTPTREGYTFEGWFTAQTEGEAVTADHVYTADTTIYARWTENIYTITFDAAGGTVTQESAKTGEGRKLASLPTPTREGYIFEGWFTAATGGTRVTLDDVYTADTTLYAQWTEVVEDAYVITFDANGGTVSPGSAQTGADKKLGSLPTPTREGYVFDGWFTAATGGTKVTLDRVYGADTRLYAQWTEAAEDAYRITFDANGGTVTPESAETGEGRKLESLPTPTREGYIFDGWFTAATGGTRVTLDDVYTADTTLYAQWERNYSSDGGSDSDSSSGSTSTDVYQEILPKNYQGGTKIINHVKVPDYTVEGTWKQQADGKWRLSGPDGNDYAGCWVYAYNPYANQDKDQSAFDWFLFDDDGNVVTGWYNDANGDVYFLNTMEDNTQGAMAVGWKLIDGNWYYFNEESDGTRGRLLKNTTTPDGHRVDENGVRID